MPAEVPLEFVQRVNYLCDRLELSQVHVMHGLARVDVSERFVLVVAEKTVCVHLFLVLSMDLHATVVRVPCLRQCLQVEIVHFVVLLMSNRLTEFDCICRVHSCELALLSAFQPFFHESSLTHSFELLAHVSNDVVRRLFLTLS